MTQDPITFRTNNYISKTVSICSPHAILIAGFRAITRSFEGFEVVSEWQSAAELRESLPVLKAEVLIVETTSDVTLDILGEIARVRPEISLVLWVDGISLEFVYQALNLGIRGILRKNSTVDQYEECLRQMAKGELYIEQSVSHRLLRTRQIALSPRQRVLMGLVAQGLRNKEIAWQMGITEGTVKVYLSHLFDRLGVSDRMELALLALRNTVADQTNASETRDSVRAGKSDFFVPALMTSELMGNYAR